MSNQNHSRGTFGKGYYIALILCAVAIGISGYVYYRNNALAETPVQEVSQTDGAGTPAGREDNVPVVATQPTGEVTVPATGETTAPTRAPGMKVCAPVDGETIYGYAMDCLAYNETTRDWRTHNGVDISAPAGTAVVAACDGTVYTTFSDDRLGTTVVIRHSGGYTTQYSSLAEELAVAPGDQVRMGQAIGQVGSTALVENTLGDHVHFSVTCRDEAMDPQEFLALGE